MKYKGSEDDFQIMIATYLDLKKVVWFHCPNGGNRNPKEAYKLKQMGVKAGVPDILIFEPRMNYVGLAIELKVSGRKPRENQLKWMEDLTKKGWLTFWADDLDDVLEEIDKYLNFGK